MDYFMIRSFDQAGYYETRLVLLVLCLAVAVYFLKARRDFRYLLMLLNGALWQAAMEMTLALFGLRGAGFSISAFGFAVPSAITWLVQGLTEGGVLCLMSFWFLDLYLDRPARRRGWAAYGGMCVLIVLLSCIVGVLALGEDVTSRRDMFAPISVVLTTYVVIVSLAVVAVKGGSSFRYLSIYFLGCLLFFILKRQPVHLLGGRYIAESTADGGLAVASLANQFWLMLYSHLNVTAGKIHYFVVPYALGFLGLPTDAGRREDRTTDSGKEVPQDGCANAGARSARRAR